LHNELRYTVICFLLWTRKDWAAGLERIEIIRAACAGVDARDCPQPHPVDPPGIIIRAGDISSLDPVDPQSHPTIVTAFVCGGMPNQLNAVWSIPNGNPGRIQPNVAVVLQRSSKLIPATGETELDTQDKRGCASIAMQQGMDIPIRHLNGIRIEIELDPVTGFGIRLVVSDKYGFVIVHHCT
jgi:hypothetical protein